MNEVEITNLVSKELGLEQLPEEMQQDILARLGEAALKNALLEVLDKLPTEAEGEFKKVSESGDVAKIQYFLKQQIPDYESIMKRSVIKVVEEFKRVKAGFSENS
jgi:hypothetical protein